MEKNARRSVVSLAEAAKLAGVSLTTARRWAHTGAVKANKVGDAWEINRDDVLAKVASGANPPDIAVTEAVVAAKLEQRKQPTKAKKPFNVRPLRAKTGHGVPLIHATEPEAAKLDPTAPSGGVAMAAMERMVVSLVDEMRAGRIAAAGELRRYEATIDDLRDQVTALRSELQFVRALPLPIQIPNNPARQPGDVEAESARQGAVSVDWEFVGAGSVESLESAGVVTGEHMPAGHQPRADRKVATEETPLVGAAASGSSLATAVVPRRRTIIERLFGL